MGVNSILKFNPSLTLKNAHKLCVVHICMGKHKLYNRTKSCVIFKAEIIADYMLLNVELDFH
jgi:hypothetical protein